MTTSRFTIASIILKQTKNVWLHHEWRTLKNTKKMYKLIGALYASFLVELLTWKLESFFRISILSSCKSFSSCSREEDWACRYIYRFNNWTKSTIGDTRNQLYTIDSFKVASKSCRSFCSFCLSATLSLEVSLLPMFNTGKKDPFVASFSSFKADNLWLLSSSSLIVLSSSPAQEHIIISKSTKTKHHGYPAPPNGTNLLHPSHTPIPNSQPKNKVNIHKYNTF